MISRSLRHFLAVYERGNITAAAEDLRLTQPALTRSLKTLEEGLGVELFERLSGGVRPTIYGEVLSTYAKRMAAEHRHALMEIEALRGGVAGQIRIGAGPLWNIRYLPPMIAAFGQTHPGVRFSISEGVSAGLLGKLLVGEIDLLCSSLNFLDHPDVEKIEMVTLRNTFIARTDHPLAARSDAVAADLLDHPWAQLVFDPEDMTYLHAYFRDKGLPAPTPVIATSTISSACEALVSGPYVACLPEPVLDLPIGRHLCALPIDPPERTYSVGVAVLKARQPSPAVQRFIESMKAYFAPSAVR